MNPYDRCGAKNTINRMQCTVLWHAYDLKISYVDSNVVYNILELLDK